MISKTTIKKKLPTIFEEGQNFHNTWVHLLKKVVFSGIDLEIGGGDERKPILDSCALINLYGNAIHQIEEKELHPQFPFRRIEEYCKEFTVDYVQQYRREKGSKFSYLYMDRLLNWSPYEMKHLFPPIDQLAILTDSLETQKTENVTSNRNQAITWVPHHDPYKHSPCLQRIQIRYIPENKVDVHLTWRSRDLYNAWQPNLICIVDMLNREVIKPNGCEIIRLIDYNDSLHIYQTDILGAREVKFVLVSPQEMNK